MASGAGLVGRVPLVTPDTLTIPAGQTLSAVVDMKAARLGAIQWLTDNSGSTTVRLSVDGTTFKNAKTAGLVTLDDVGFPFGASPFFGSVLPLNISHVAGARYFELDAGSAVPIDRTFAISYVYI